jgi:hypothetical protein
MRFRHAVDVPALPACARWFGPAASPTAWGPPGLSGFRCLSVDEHFFRWEQNRRFSFYLTAHSMPLVHALAEDYLLEELAPGHTRFTYSVAIEPRRALSMAGPIARTRIDSLLRNACKGLQSYVLKAGPSRRVGEGASKASGPGPAPAPNPSAERKTSSAMAWSPWSHWTWRSRWCVHKSLSQ